MCIECNGSAVCEHKRQRMSCRECRGSSICEHLRIRNTCRQCNGGSICVHDRMRSVCKDCHGGSICEHSKLRSLCIDCHGNGICDHLVRRNSCKECHGSSICVHLKHRANCRVCMGSGFCKCGILKSHCAEHGGRALCVICRYVCANPKYSKHCADCFVNYYPDDPRSKKKGNLMRRETVVRQAIDCVFKDFMHDKAYYTGKCCAHRRRIDHRLHINDTVLAIETDEDAHVSYNKDDEIIRYDDLVVALGTKFVFIRFNPDTNREELGAKTTLDHKIKALLLCIGMHIHRIRKTENTELFQIVKLFYCKACSQNGSDICLCPEPE